MLSIYLVERVLTLSEEHTGQTEAHYLSYWRFMRTFIGHKQGLF